MNNTIYNTSPILIIYGPTGVGKTDIALSVACSMPAEIINMDVGQFYTPFSIGTAKPDWKNHTVPHHLFDIIDTPRDYTVVEYRKVVQEKIKQIRMRGKIPILVGGSAFYLYVLFFPPNEKSLNSHRAEYVDTKNLWDALHAIDPKRAKNIEKNDSYRIMRALEIWGKTYTAPSDFVPRYDPIGDYVLVYATRDTQELNKRINERVISMIGQGWIEETQQVLGTPWENFITTKKLIGYNEIIAYIRGRQDKKSFDTMVEVIQNKTRQYAKRQRTFWRKIERDIKKQWLYAGKSIGCLEILDLTNTDLQLYINELLKRLFIRR